MRTMSQNEIKDNFFEIFNMVKNGEKIMVKGEHDQENFAVIIPCSKYSEHKDRPLWILKGKANFEIKDDFKISDEELLTRATQRPIWQNDYMAGY